MGNYQYKVKVEEDEFGNEINSDNILTTFKESCSTHGVAHAHHALGKIKLSFWLLLAFSCTVGLLYNLVAIISTYRQFQVYTKTEMQHARELHFPAVSVCNTNPLKASNIDQSPALSSLLSGWESSTPVKRRRRKRSSCPEDVESDSGICFWIEDLDNTKSFAESEQLCADAGGMLPIIDTSAKRDHILDKFRNLKNVYVNLQYDADSETWSWNADDATSWIEWQNDGSFDRDPSPGERTGCAYMSLAELKMTTSDCDGETIEYRLGWSVRKDPCCYTMCQDPVDPVESQITTTAKTTSRTESPPTTTIKQQSTTESPPTTTIKQQTTTESPPTTTIKQQTTTESPPTTTIKQQTTTESPPTTTIKQRTTTESQPTAKESITTAAPNTTIRYQSILTESHISSIVQSTITQTTQAQEISLDLTAVESTTLAHLTTTGFQSQFSREPVREDFKRESEVLQVLAELSEEEKRDLGYEYHEFILGCNFARNPCRLEDFTHFFDAVHGNCFVFNAAWNQSNIDYKTSQSGRKYGFELVVNIGQQEYMESIGESAGAVVVVHNQHRMSFPEDEGVFALPGYITSVGIKRLDVNRLGGVYSDCTGKDNSYKINVFAEKYGVDYSNSACEKTCYQKHVIETCECADSQYPTSGEAFGNVQHRSCDVRNTTEDDCVYGVTLKYINNELDCDCPLLCQDTLYSYSVSKMTWPNDKEKHRILSTYSSQLAATLNSSTDDEYFRRNLLKIEVYFDDLSYKILSEVPKYTLVRFASDLGSLVGLWLGCSLFSLLEFLELGLDLLVLSCKRFMSKSLSSKKKEKVAPISEKTTKHSVSRSNLKAPKNSQAFDSSGRSSVTYNLRRINNSRLKPAKEIRAFDSISSTTPTSEKSISPEDNRASPEGGMSSNEKTGLVSKTNVARQHANKRRVRRRNSLSLGSNEQPHSRHSSNFIDLI